MGETCCTRWLEVPCMSDSKEGLGCVCEKGAETVQSCGCRATQSPRGRVEPHTARCLSAVSAGSAFPRFLNQFSKSRTIMHACLSNDPSSPKMAKHCWLHFQR